jgi:hypothetical protein
MNHSFLLPEVPYAPRRPFAPRHRPRAPPPPQSAQKALNLKPTFVQAFNASYPRFRTSRYVLSQIVNNLMLYFILFWHEKEGGFLKKAWVDMSNCREQNRFSEMLEEECNAKMQRSPPSKWKPKLPNCCEILRFAIASLLKKPSPVQLDSDCRSPPPAASGSRVARNDKKG